MVIPIAHSAICPRSCPVARKSAAKTFAICALAPILPESIDPYASFLCATSQIAGTVVFNIEATISADSTTSAEILVPLPSIKLRKFGFLSTHIFPDSAMQRAVVCSSIKATILSTAIVAIFIPMASSVSNLKRKKTFFPINHGFISKRVR